MIQGKIKNEPVEEEEDFDEKQSDASDLENHEDDEVEIIGMMERIVKSIYFPFEFTRFLNIKFRNMPLKNRTSS